MANSRIRVILNGGEITASSDDGKRVELYIPSGIEFRMEGNFSNKELTKKDVKDVVNKALDKVFGQPTPAPAPCPPPVMVAPPPIPMPQPIPVAQRPNDESMVKVMEVLENLQTEVARLSKMAKDKKDTDEAMAVKKK
jgi:hypothetical protein